MDREQITFGDFLKASRHAKELSLRDVEREVDISNAYLSQLESGKIKNPSPNILHKLASLYGVSYRELMQLAGYPVPELAESPVTRLASRIGPVTEAEEQALIDYLSFLRTRRDQGGNRL